MNIVLNFLKFLKLWIVAASCCVINLILDGTVRCSGLFYVAVQQAYGVDRRSASLPFTVCVAVRNLSGIFIGVLAKKYGPGSITLLGGFVGALGIGLCYFSTTVTWISIAFGLIFGFGYGMGNIFLPLIISNTFKEAMSSATGISFSGSCMGSLILPPLFAVVMNNYGLHGTFLFTGGLVLNCVPLSMILIHFAKSKTREIFDCSRKRSKSEDGDDNNGGEDTVGVCGPIQSNGKTPKLKYPKPCRTVSIDVNCDYSKCFEKNSNRTGSEDHGGSVTGSCSLGHSSSSAGSGTAVNRSESNAASSEFDQTNSSEASHESCRSSCRTFPSSCTDRRVSNELSVSTDEYTLHGKSNGGSFNSVGSRAIKQHNAIEQSAESCKKSRLGTNETSPKTFPKHIFSSITITDKEVFTNVEGLSRDNIGPSDECNLQIRAIPERIGSKKGSVFSRNNSSSSISNNCIDSGQSLTTDNKNPVEISDHDNPPKETDVSPFPFKDSPKVAHADLVEVQVSEDIIANSFDLYTKPQTTLQLAASEKLDAENMEETSHYLTSFVKPTTNEKSLSTTNEETSAEIANTSDSGWSENSQSTRKKPLPIASGQFPVENLHIVRDSSPCEAQSSLEDSQSDSFRSNCTEKASQSRQMQMTTDNDDPKAIQSGGGSSPQPTNTDDNCITNSELTPPDTQSRSSLNVDNGKTMPNIIVTGSNENLQSADTPKARTHIVQRLNSCPSVVTDDSSIGRSSTDGSRNLPKLRVTVIEYNMSDDTLERLQNEAKSAPKRSYRRHANSVSHKYFETNDSEGIGSAAQWAFQYGKTPKKPSKSFSSNLQSKTAIHVGKNGAVPASSKFHDHKSKTGLLSSFSVIKNPCFLMLTLLISCYEFIFVSITTIIADHSKDLGIPDDRAKWLLMAFSTGNIFSRLCLGWFTDSGLLKRNVYTACCFIGLAVSVASMSHAWSFKSLAVFYAGYGIFESGAMVMFPLLMKEYLKEQDFIMALPLSNFGPGIVTLLIPVVIGVFKDSTGSYDGLFYVMIALAITSVAICLLLPRLHGKKKPECS